MVNGKERDSSAQKCVLFMLFLLIMKLNQWGYLRFYEWNSFSYIIWGLVSLPVIFSVFFFMNEGKSWRRCCFTTIYYEKKKQGSL